MSLRDVWSACATLDRDRELLADLRPAYLEAARYAWDTFAMPHQVPPPGARDGMPWTIWLIMAGRGAGNHIEYSRFTGDESVEEDQEVLFGLIAEFVRE